MRKREIKPDSTRRNRSVCTGKSMGSDFRAKEVIFQRATLAAMVWLQFMDVFCPIRRFLSQHLKPVSVL